MRSGLRNSPVPFTPGISILPEDFPERLTALKELLGLTWEGMACCLGVDPRQLQQWRNGGCPNGGAMLALVDLATRVPGGLGVLLDRDVLVVHRNEHGGRTGAAA
ncbi:MAG: helix-turn-helix domain-containing protein [Chloroflexi bacterium]|nr:helix-turn-helix domain-containing protein [Chloroflexota bacterium]